MSEIAPLTASENLVTPKKPMASQNYVKVIDGLEFRASIIDDVDLGKITRVTITDLKSKSVLQAQGLVGGADSDHSLFLNYFLPPNPDGTNGPQYSIACAFPTPTKQ